MIDRDITDALRVIRRDAETNPTYYAVRLAVEYLDARIPVGSPARLMLLMLRDHLAAHARRLHAGDDEGWQPLLDVLDSLTSLVGEKGVPPVRTVRDPGALAEVARDLGVAYDWHEPDQAEVEVHVTDGSFDNGGIATLERTVLLFKEGVPVAQVQLAAVLAWACEAATVRAQVHNDG